ncbi:MAG: type II secretion system F family protein [Candidatus Margulisbacteria bacterium]|jgi:type II secretory pathway component PulF|nr:type II secretion system F family protein [Candidatus Margulisiibacteriota bacterium]
MPELKQNLELLEELDAFLRCGYQPGEILELLASELGCRYRQRLQRGQAWSAVWELEPEMALILRTAELNGRLRDFIALALEYYKNKISFQKALRQKAAYPVLTLVFTLLLLLGFIFFLLPMFNGLTAELGGRQSPRFWQWLIIGLVVAPGCAVRPLSGLLLERTGLKRLQNTLQQLNLLLLTDRAGIPLANFLAEYLPANPQPELARIYFYLNKGLPVGEALARAEVFSRAELKLLTVGGGANYSRGLEYLQNACRQNYQRKIDGILFWLEPGLLLFAGGVIALISWSFFRPLFSLSGLEF